MIASGATIRSRVGMLMPFAERTRHGSGMTYGLGPAGYDIRSRDDVWLAPGGFALFDALETFDMPCDLIGVVHDKSTWARLGLAVQNTVVEPGWRGVLRLEASNHGAIPLCVEAGAPIAQVLFHLLDQPVPPYEGRYQDQRPGQDAILADRRVFRVSSAAKRKAAL